MKTIQVVLDAKLLRAADRVVHRTKQNRSALIREALRAHLQRLEIRALEKRDQEGYAKGQPVVEDWSVWESEAAWPQE